MIVLDAYQAGKVIGDSEEGIKKGTGFLFLVGTVVYQGWLNLFAVVRWDFVGVYRWIPGEPYEGDLL